MSGSKIVVDAAAFQAMVVYLSKCPYQEVANVLIGLQNKIEPYEEGKNDAKVRPEKPIPNIKPATDVSDGLKKETILEKKVNKKV